MSKKYYWLKLKEDFFDDKQIKYLRKLPSGSDLVIVYLKMQLKALKTEGIIKYDNILPSCEEELALILDEDVNIISLTLNALIKVGAIEKMDDGSLYMLAMQDLIGKEGESAERVRKFRESQKLLTGNTKALQCNNDVTNCNTEIEIDIEKEKDIDIENENSSNFNNEDDIDKLFPLTNQSTSSTNNQGKFKYLKSNAFLENYFSKVTTSNNEIAEAMVSLIENKVKSVTPKFHFTPNKKGNAKYEILEYSRKNGVEMNCMIDVLQFALNDNWWGDKIDNVTYFINNYTKIALKFSTKLSTKTSVRKGEPFFKDKEREFSEIKQGENW